MSHPTSSMISKCGQERPLAAKIAGNALNSRLESEWDYGQSRPVAANAPGCNQSTAASGGQATATKNATQNATRSLPETAASLHARRMLRLAAAALTVRLNVIDAELE